MMWVPQSADLPSRVEFCDRLDPHVAEINVDPHVAESKCRALHPHVAIWWMAWQCVGDERAA